MKRQITHFSPRSAAELREDNRRKSKRFPTSQRAWIMKDSEGMCFCEIVDMSASGAQIKVPQEDTFPTRFNLLIVGETYMKRVPVAVQWRSPGRMGVLFLSDGVFI